MSVAIVGCGPASLAAAWAAQGLGEQVEIFAQPVRSKLRGPILLQRPVPGITTTHPDGWIAQHVIGGSILDYREKLYGDVNISINGDILEPGYDAWKMEETYDKLWNEFHSRIVPMTVDTDNLVGLQEEYDLVVNTAPRDQFCLRDHEFKSKVVALTWETQVRDQEPNSIYFNAVPDVAWVRSSNVFGNVVTEWDPERAPQGSHTIYKPISTTCDCWPHIYKTGRFGAWRNETWVDTAYYDTRRALMR